MLLKCRRNATVVMATLEVKGGVRGSDAVPEDSRTGGEVCDEESYAKQSQHEHTRCHPRLPAPALQSPINKMCGEFRLHKKSSIPSPRTADDIRLVHIRTGAEMRLGHGPVSTPQPATNPSKRTSASLRQVGRKTK